jgi:hypothetical protein
MRPLKRTALIVTILGTAIVSAASAFAQNTPNTQAGQNASAILPDNFAGWSTTNRQPYSPSAQQPGGGNADQGAAPAAREYGFLGGETALYQPLASGSIRKPDDTLTATVYRMKDPSGAYGEYSYLRTPDMAPGNFSDHSSVKANEVVILLGNLVLDVQGPDAQHDAADIKALAAAVAPKAEEGLLPTLPEHVPGENRVAGSDHYILGPQTLDRFFPVGLGYSLGFNFGAEAETAHFHLGSNDATLLIADFPTPQIAQSQLDALTQKFNINGSHAGSNLPALFAQRSQTMIAIVAGAPSADAAIKLLDKVNAREALTWNEPTFQFHEPRFEVMVVGAFVGTGIICVLVAVGALAFGGFRLTIKKLFPNVFFDRPTQIEILQMGLVSKIIKAEDFYRFDGKRIDDSSVDKNLPDRTALRLFK